MSNSRQHASSYSQVRRLKCGESYTYGWNRMGRKGETCVLEVIGAKNSVRILFRDGYRAITSANALRNLLCVAGSDQPSLF
jgi:hypothetical protein